MFGLFKKKKDTVNEVQIAVRKEFDTMIAAARAAPLSKQARVGKGMNEALATFDRKYTKNSFNELDFPEKKSFLEVLARRQEELRLLGGDVSIEHIGYSLASRWVMAVAGGDDELVNHFEKQMQYFKRAAQTL